MPNFDINSRFNKEANFNQVVFGEDGYVLETELNEMQHIQDEARASLIRESIPSGVLNYFEPTMLPTTPNAFKLGQEMKVNVNGQILTIPKDTTIQLNEPPTADFKSVTGKVGYREDLVFLEAWKEEVTFESNIPKFGGEGQSNVTNTIKDTRVGVETTRRIQWKWRIRVADDVNFTKFPNGFTDETYGNPNSVPPQGGASTPIDLVNMWSNNNTWSFRKANSTFYTLSDDVGLYIAGNGSNSQKTTFKSVDGYVYAIPLFRVKRRNSGGYSVENGNGALSRTFSAYTGGGEVIEYSTSTRWVARLNDIAMFNLGDIVTRTDLTNQGVLTTSPYYMDYCAIVTDIHVPSKTVTFNNVYSKSPWNLTSNSTEISILNKPYRPDKLFSNIIDSRDIIDLRHKVSLTGFNYQELLEENFDKLLRGELTTKEGKKMLKTYHGIRKTPIDSNTVFYMSGDSPTPELGNSLLLDSYLNSVTHDYSPVGRSISVKYLGKFVSLPSECTRDFTIDFFVDITKFINSKGFSIMGFKGSDSYCTRGVVEVWCDQMGYLSVEGYVPLSSPSSASRIYDAEIKLPTDIRFCHVRICGTRGSNIDVYLNGIKRFTTPYTDNLPNMERFALSSFNGTTSGGSDVLISDFSVSKINRGNNFATLPKDFIDGYATISTAFNEQIEIYGDPIMSQVCQEVIKCTGETKRQFTITKVGTNWASGDTIKVKGLGSEVISGLIDTDTAIASIVGYESPRNSAPYTVIVSQTTGLQVGDEVRYSPPKGELWTATYNLKITNIDGNKVTLVRTDSASSNIDLQYAGNGGYLIETTASSSSPVLKYMNGTTPTNVTGTWTGLGTNECTFTFGTNSTLTNQDLEIQYSLNAPSGQGGISEVFTETLGGEYKGKKLTKQSELVIVDDFKGKVVNSEVECPNIYYWSVATSLKQPNTFHPCDNQDYYNKLMDIDAKNETLTVSNNNYIPQMQFSFDLIRIIEDKFGEIPSVDKVSWIKSNVKDITFEVNGYGTCPSGSKITLSGFQSSNSTWWTPITSYASTTTSVFWGTPYVSNLVSDTGKCYLLTYTDATDNVTPSNLYINYVKIKLSLKVDSNFEVLSPENTRRDDGLSGALLVRKETKEIRRYPLGKAKETDGLVTYGDYIPYQLVSGLSPTTLLVKQSALLTTLGTSGVPNNLQTEFYRRNMIYNLTPLESYKYDCSQLNIIATMYSSGCSIYKYLDVVHNHNKFQYLNIEDSKKLIEKGIPFIYYTPSISIFNNELYLSVMWRDNKSVTNTQFGIGSGLELVFKLKGSPIVKEAF